MTLFYLITEQNESENGAEEAAKAKVVKTPNIKPPTKPPTPISIFTAYAKDRMKASPKFAELSTLVCYHRGAFVVCSQLL